MPNFPYQDAGRAVSQVGNSFQDLALGLAQQKFQVRQYQHQMQLQMARQRQQQMLDEKHGALYDAQALFNQQRTKSLQNQDTTGNALGQALQGMFESGNFQNPMAQGAMAGSAGRMVGYGRKDVGANIAQILQLQDPRMQQLMATGTKAAIPISSQGGIADVISGIVSDQTPQKLNQGQTLVPATGGAAIATGLPGKASTDYSLERQLASNQSLLGKFIGPLGPPSQGIPGDPRHPMDTSYPFFKQVQDEVTRLQKALADREAGIIKPTPRAGELNNFPQAPTSSTGVHPGIQPSASSTDGVTGQAFSAAMTPSINPAVDQVISELSPSEVDNPPTEPAPTIAPVRDMRTLVPRSGEMNDYPPKPNDTGVTIARPQTQEEFDKLMDGVKFINPADGKVMIKRSRAQRSSNYGNPGLDYNPQQTPYP